MKTIEVVAAIIKHDEKILVTKRASGEFKDMWEFPGGKIEENESREDALRREILEELEVEIDILNFLTTVEYDYPSFHLIMHCFICEIKKGNINLNVHSDASWALIGDMDNLNWIPADVDVLDSLKNYIG